MRTKAHPFVPGGWQTPLFLTWLRRTHAWLGVGGAALGIMFSVTTLLLEHDNFGMASEAIDTEYEIALPLDAALSVDNFAAFIAEEFGVRGNYTAALRNAPADVGGNFAIRWRSPGDEWSARYEAGSNVATVTFTDRSFVETINALHTATGVSMAWKLFSDAFAGALIVLSLTGLMLWTRLQGGRLLALGLIGSVTLVSFFAMTMSA